MPWVFAPLDPLIRPHSQEPEFWPLRRLSDFLFVTHENLCQLQYPHDPTCMPRLQWVMHTFITNDATNMVVNELYANPTLPRGRYPPWPGDVFTMQPPPPNLFGRNPAALVGCPSGAGTPIYYRNMYNSTDGRPSIPPQYSRTMMRRCPLRGIFPTYRLGCLHHLHHLHLDHHLNLLRLDHHLNHLHKGNEAT